MYRCPVAIQTVQHVMKTSDEPSSRFLRQRRLHNKMLFLIAFVFYVLSSLDSNMMRKQLPNKTEVGSGGRQQFVSCNQSSFSGTTSNKVSATKEHNAGVPPPLSHLTRSYMPQNIDCPEPLVPLYDKILDRSSSNETNHQKIPKSIHFAWIRGFNTNQSRCISPDMMEIPTKWMKQFPSYDIYFHDDEAVDAMFAQDWPEFPQLSKLIKACVHFGGAMRIDIWRALVLYRYGGFYSDFDVAPGPLLYEYNVHANDSAFFLSDAWMRPSQWLQGMEAKHPIAYFTVLEIMKKLLELNDVSDTGNLVFLTGPDALKFGYYYALDHSIETYEKAFDVGYHIGMHGERIQKLPSKMRVWKNIKNQVLYPRNSTVSGVSNATTANVTMMTVRHRINREMNTMHWTQALRQEKSSKPKFSCRDLLYKIDNNIPY